MIEDTLFGPITVAPAPCAEGGADARRTARRQELIDQGINPGTMLPVHPDGAEGRSGPGLRCGTCRSLYAKPCPSAKTFYKCRRSIDRADVYGAGPDMRAWWPACTRYDGEPHAE